MDWDEIVSDAVSKGLIHIDTVCGADSVLNQLREANLREVAAYRDRLEKFIKLYTRGAEYNPGWLYWLEWVKASTS